MRMCGDRGRIVRRITKTNTKKDPRRVRTAEEEAAYYRSIQLTPEQKAELRAELKKEMERAKAAGVYQRVLDLHQQRVRERASASMLRDGDVRKK